MRQWEDHGDPSVDKRWREAIRRSAPVARMVPTDLGDWVPAEYANEQTIPESYFICEDILAATKED